MLALWYQEFTAADKTNGNRLQCESQHSDHPDRLLLLQHSWRPSPAPIQLVTVHRAPVMEQQYVVANRA